MVVDNTADYKLSLITFLLFCYHTNQCLPFLILLLYISCQQLDSNTVANYLRGFGKKFIYSWSIGLMPRLNRMTQKYAWWLKTFLCKEMPCGIIWIPQVTDQKPSKFCSQRQNTKKSLKMFHKWKIGQKVPRDNHMKWGRRNPMVTWVLVCSAPNSLNSVSNFKAREKHEELSNLYHSFRKMLNFWPGCYFWCSLPQASIVQKPSDSWMVLILIQCYWTAYRRPPSGFKLVRSHFSSQ